MRKVNNFAAAGNEDPGPTEDFQIKCGLAYVVGVIGSLYCVKIRWGQISHCPHMFRQAWSIGLEAK